MCSSGLKKEAEVNLLLSLMMRKQYSREWNQLPIQFIITSISKDLTLLVVTQTQRIRVSILPSKPY